MKEQKAIIEQFKTLYGNPTLKTIEALTGIQKTRFFRICHGMEMRLDEFLILKRLTEKKSKIKDHLDEVLDHCRQEMNLYQLKELEAVLYRHLQKCIYLNDLEKSKEEEEVFSA